MDKKVEMQVSISTIAGMVNHGRQNMHFGGSNCEKEQ
jgi:hypothetical protein